MKYFLNIKYALVAALFFLFPLNVFAQYKDNPFNKYIYCPGSSSYYNCGFGLLHAGGMCVHPLGGATIPVDGTRLILFPSCNTSSESRLRFRILSNGSLYHISSSKCVHPEGGSANPGAGTRLVFWSSCTDGPVSDANGNKRLAFEFTYGGSIRHKNSGLCVQPSGGSSNPASETQLVLWGVCDGNAQKFTQLPY